MKMKIYENVNKIVTVVSRVVTVKIVGGNFRQCFRETFLLSYAKLVTENRRLSGVIMGIIALITIHLSR